VAFPWGKSESSIQSFTELANVTFGVFSFNNRHGGTFLYVLHFMEAIPDTTWSSRDWVDHLSEWKQSIE
jgi:hypothetical protein